MEESTAQRTISLALLVAMEIGTEAHVEGVVYAVHLPGVEVCPAMATEANAHLADSGYSWMRLLPGSFRRLA